MVGTKTRETYDKLWNTYYVLSKSKPFNSLDLIVNLLPLQCRCYSFPCKFVNNLYLIDLSILITFC